MYLSSYACMSLLDKLYPVILLIDEYLTDEEKIILAGILVGVLGAIVLAEILREQEQQAKLAERAKLEKLVAEAKKRLDDKLKELEDFKKQKAEAEQKAKEEAGKRIIEEIFLKKK